LELLEQKFKGLSAPQPGDTEFFDLLLFTPRAPLRSILLVVNLKNPKSDTQNFDFLVKIRDYFFSFSMV